MKQKILITRDFFPDIIERLREYFDVEVNKGRSFGNRSI